MRAMICKGLLVFSLVLVGFAGSAVLEPVPVEAAACPNGLLKDVRLSYIPGCTIDDKTFQFLEILSEDIFLFPGGVTPSITVDPSPLNPGFTLSLASPATFTAGQSSSAAASFTVTVNPGGQPIKDISMSLGGFSTTGPGTLEVAASLPGGSTFSVGGPGG